MIPSVLLAGLGLLLALPAEALPDEGAISFQRDVHPILSDRCFRCHGPDRESRQADLRLDRREDAVASAVVPGDPAASPLIERVGSSDPDQRMPPAAEGGKRLTDRQIAILRKWIAQGARYERHWSLVPPRRPPLPPVDDVTWPRGAIDRFILARLEREGLSPSPPADRVTLIRRLYFDLLGLPPTVEAIDAFLADPRPDAYLRLVDRLFASPHFGERMAIYWLDLVRYADSVGYHGDQEQPITPYRDYVIDAFNENMAFDRFTIEQLAGDLLPDATERTRIASGYNRVLQTSHEGGIQHKEYLAKYSADRVRNLSSVWMATTLACAECHDHKYDPYTQRDFYRLAAFFADVDDTGTFRGSDTTPTRREPEIVVYAPWDREALDRLNRQAEALAQQMEAGDRLAAGPDGHRRAELETKLRQVRDRIKKIESRGRRTMVTVAIEPRTIRVLARGDWMDESGEIVAPGTPACLDEVMGRAEPARPAASGGATRAAVPTGSAGGSGGGKRRATRLDLARWLTASDHPQTSRVLANRLWYLLFGTGICKTLDDVGSQGEWPSHPELLDYLAVELVESGWDIKHLMRQIVLSRTYRQTSLASAALVERDPENRLLARQSRFRLPAEMVRDMALSVSRLLVRRIGGPSARPYQPAGYYAHLNFPKRKYHPDHGEGQYRRGVYVHWQRQFLHPMLKAFDAPSREECTARRPTSNTPLAALVLLNDPTFVEAARVFAERIVNEGGGGTGERIAWAWRQVLGRAADQDEVSMLAAFFQEKLRAFSADRPGDSRQPDDRRPRAGGRSAAKADGGSRTAAQRLIDVGDWPVPSDTDPAVLAAWTEVARALLNLSESITRN